jgi:hypothetical protein
VKMVNVNYRAEAGLYHRVIGGWKTNVPLGYKRFRTTAGAVRFAIEQLPKLEVGDERYNEAEIRQLYDGESLKKARQALILQKARATTERRNCNRANSTDCIRCSR